MKYATKQDVLDYLLLEVEATFEDRVDEYIEYATEEINTITQRVFIAEDSERLYDGNNRTQLLVDDFVELDSVELDDNEIVVIATPNNTTPKNILYYENVFHKGRQNVKVNAKWGYSETPPKDIIYACVVLTAGIIQTNLAGINDIKSEKLGNYTITYKDEKQISDYDRAIKILNRYKKYVI